MPIRTLSATGAWSCTGPRLPHGEQDGRRCRSSAGATDGPSSRGRVDRQRRPSPAQAGSRRRRLHPHRRRTPAPRPRPGTPAELVRGGDDGVGHFHQPGRPGSGPSASSATSTSDRDRPARPGRYRAVARRARRCERNARVCVPGPSVRAPRSWTAPRDSMVHCIRPRRPRRYCASIRPSAAGSRRSHTRCGSPGMPPTSWSRSGITFALLRYTDVRRRRAEARSEELLTNAIPRSIATRLQRGDARIAESYPETTVLFADLAGFTPWARRTDSALVVSFLDALFTRFDELAADAGVEKIEDAWRCLHGGRRSAGGSGRPRVGCHPAGPGNARRRRRRLSTPGRPAQVQSASPADRWWAA